MIKEITNIENKSCILYLQKESKYILIQPVDDNEIKLLDNEVEYILKNSKEKFSLVTFKINDWNSELTPWEMPLVFGKGNFGSGASDTLNYIVEKLIPQFEKNYKEYINENVKYILGGYSLAGLFSLWTAYENNRFYGIVSASPSIWYNNWLDYAEKKEIKIENLYLSLGDTEDKTKNQIMARVSDNMKKQYELIKESKNIKKYILEWNEGSHFKETDIRIAKGFVWMINN